MRMDTPGTRFHPIFLLCTGLATLLGGWLNSDRLLGSDSLFGTGSSETLVSPDPLCPQVPALPSSQHSTLNQQLDSAYSSETFKLASFQLLSASVRIPTESYDDLAPVGKDERWNIFADFHAYLEGAFPRVYSALTVSKVNTYALVFHWQGSVDSLKPLLLAAHQDVVPVDWSTEDHWVHPPYSGHYDGTWIWGRGSVDDKADLVSQLIAVNSLLDAGFRPKRTIVLAFGIDEEAAGTEGAGKLAVYLEEKYGQDAFAMLLDEGEGYGENVKEGTIFAVPGVSEKGYFDARIEVLAPGGHSSIPPDHTSIGLLSLLIVALEANPYQPRLTRNGTAFAAAQCAVEHNTDPEKFPFNIKDLARRAKTSDKALEQFSRALFKADPFFKILSRTTQAVDLVQGGVKINALPERAEAVINHRIAEHSSTFEVKKHITDLVLPFAELYNLSVEAFGRNMTSNLGETKGGAIVLSDAFYSSLEPSPITPVHNNAAYNLLSGTIKSTLQTSTRYRADDVVVMPSLGLGNTDTRFYWNLTQNIFRYSHRGDRDDVYHGLHTVNEAVRGESFIEQIRFFTNFILNVDESNLP